MSFEKDVRADAASYTIVSSFGAEGMNFDIAC
jgi:hypothetical protein